MYQEDGRMIDNRTVIESNLGNAFLGTCLPAEEDTTPWCTSPQPPCQPARKLATKRTAVKQDKQPNNGMDW